MVAGLLERGSTVSLRPRGLIADFLIIFLLRLNRDDAENADEYMIAPVDVKSTRLHYKTVTFRDVSPIIQYTKQHVALSLSVHPSIHPSLSLTHTNTRTHTHTQTHTHKHTHTHTNTHTNTHTHTVPRRGLYNLYKL